MIEACRGGNWLAAVFLTDVDGRCVCVCAVAGERSSDIEFADIEGVFFDEFASGFDGIAHENAEDFIGGGGVFHTDLEERAFFGVHAGIPKFFGVHFAETFEAGDNESFFAEFSEFFEEITEAGEGYAVVITFDYEGVNGFCVAEGWGSEVGDEESVVFELVEDFVEGADFVEVDELSGDGE